jgi:putative endonuclease
MTPHNQTVGRRGERLAEEYLLALGATLLERNFRRDYIEIDLLVEYEGELVAVEVKTRDVGDLEQPEETVRWAQLRRITRGMATYAMDNDRLEMPWRIDAILIVVEPDGGVLRFDHLRSVYPG